MLSNLKLMVSLLVLGNIAGIVGLIVWLGMSDRLSVDRMEDVREVFSATIAEERAESARLEAEEAERERRLLELGKPGTAPVDADAVMRILAERDETERDRYEREEASIRVLREALVNERQALQREQETFDAQVAAFEARRRELAEREGSAQFQKALKIYSLSKPEESRDMLLTLIGQGEIDQVVSYLNAMKSDISQRIVSSFVEVDAALAADLLERLREHGLELPDQQTNTAPPEGP